MPRSGGDCNRYAETAGVGHWARAFAGAERTVLQSEHVEGSPLLAGDRFELHAVDHILGDIYQNARPERRLGAFERSAEGGQSALENSDMQAAEPVDQRDAVGYVVPVEHQVVHATDDGRSRLQAPYVNEP